MSLELPKEPSLILRHMTDPLLARLFHLVCVENLNRPTDDTLSLPFEWIDNWFRRDYGQGENFFRRLEGKLSVAGRSVMDVGSGLGTVCFSAALRGARRVVGVDIVPRWLEFSRWKLSRDYAGLDGVVEFRHTDGSLDEIGAEKFDVIISHDAFEHYSDPEGMVARLKQRLADNGILAISFAPLWKSPYGGHIWSMTKLPWAHLLFPERIIMAERKRLLPKEPCQKFEDAIGGLNRMTLARFRGIMRKHEDLECLYFKTNVSEKLIMRVIRPVSRIPFLTEFLTHNVYSVWRLRRTASASRTCE